MLYAGIYYHKRCSQVRVIDEGGRTGATAWLANDRLTVASNRWASHARRC